MSMQNIALVIPYFGKLPWYFSYFLQCCEYNSDIDVIMFTDDRSYDSCIPSNVRIHKMSFEEMKLKLSKKMNMPIALYQPYKLCDFKPTYGYVFEEYLSGYDFWGMADIDVILGRVRTFINDDILTENDIITVRHDFIVGYFTLFRNCQSINMLFKKSRDYFKVFSTPEYLCFDECAFAYRYMDVGITFDDVRAKCNIESMTHVVTDALRSKTLRAYFDVHVIEGVNGLLKWSDGKLVYKNQYEILLYHLIQLKLRFEGKVPKKIPTSFRISKTRFY